MALQPRRQPSLYSPPWEPQILLRKIKAGNLISLITEAANTSEMSVIFYQTTRRYNPEDSHLSTHRRENLKSYSQLRCLYNVSCHILAVTPKDCPGVRKLYGGSPPHHTHFHLYPPPPPAHSLILSSSFCTHLASEIHTPGRKYDCRLLLTTITTITAVTLQIFIRDVTDFNLVELPTNLTMVFLSFSGRILRFFLETGDNRPFQILTSQTPMIYLSHTALFCMCLKAVEKSSWITRIFSVHTATECIIWLLEYCNFRLVKNSSQITRLK
jgi:hypothetical protein